jgi:methanogenic corrinoid protein MtbC1
MVVCPPGELHEIGARLVADYFTLCGFKADFIGANTPLEDIVESIRAIQPRFLAISVTNYFNLVATRAAVEKIMGLKNQFSFQVIMGGLACQENPVPCQQMCSDRLLNSFEDIRKLAEEPADVLS